MTTWNEENAVKAAYNAGFQRARTLDGSRPINAVDEDKARDEFIASHHGYRRQNALEVHRGNHATIERLMSRGTKVRVSIAGVFDDDDLIAIIESLRAVCSKIEPMLTPLELEHLTRVRRYFREVAGASGDTASAVDARRYRRLRVIGAALGDTEKVEGAQVGVSFVKRFQNLDEALDHDLRVHASRGEATPDDNKLVVDWNSEARRVLDKVIDFASGEVAR